MNRVILKYLALHVHTTSCLELNALRIVRRGISRIWSITRVFSVQPAAKVAHLQITATAVPAASVYLKVYA